MTVLFCYFSLSNNCNKLNTFQNNDCFTIVLRYCKCWISIYESLMRTRHNIFVKIQNPPLHAFGTMSPPALNVMPSPLPMTSSASQLSPTLPSPATPSLPSIMGPTGYISFWLSSNFHWIREYQFVTECMQYTIKLKYHISRNLITRK